MNNQFIPRLSFDGVDKAFQASFTGRVQKFQMGTDATQGAAFKDAMSNVLSQVNGAAQAPDALMHNAMTVGNVDVHDVMIANAKAELAVNLTAQVATKVVQAYDRILQIQI